MSDTIDINVNKIVETIEVNATPNVVQININSISVNLANQTEVNDGIVSDKVIAPNTLAGWWTYVKGLAQTFAQKITFNLGALFSPQVAPTHERGRVYFDDANDCISFMDSISGTSVQVGYEVLMRARNNTGATIPNGSVVYISGAIGQNSTVALAQSNTLPTSEIIGIATHDISNNTVGKICVFGLVNDLNTSSFTDGQMIYLSATVAGGLTSTIPASPNFVVALGVVEHAHTTQGKILVRQQRVLSNNNALGTAQNVPPTQNAVKSALDLKQDKLGIINVKNLGAVGDGVVDDSIAIRAALNFGGCVYFPKGEYLCNNLIVNSNTKIIGDGIGSTILRLNSATNPLFNCSGTSSLAKEMIEFESLTLMHNKTHTISGISGCLIVAFNSKNINIRKVEFKQFNAYGILTKDLDNQQTLCEGVTISECIFKDGGTTSIGIYFDQESEYSNIVACRFKNLFRAIYLFNAANNTINNNVFLNANVFCLFTPANNSGKFTFTNNKLNHGEPLEIRNSNSSGEFGCVIVGNEFYATNTHGLRLTGGKNNIVTGNRFWPVSGRAIRLFDFSGVVCDYNIITNNTSLNSLLIENLSTGTNNIILNNLENVPR